MLIPGNRFISLYNRRVLNGTTLLAHLKAQANASKPGPRFRPFTGQTNTELVGMVNLAVRNDRLCFLLQVRERSEKIPREYYALPVGRRFDREISEVEEVHELGDLMAMGLITWDETRASGESIFRAAVRRNTDKTGLKIKFEDVIGRIEFQAMQEDTKVVVFIADASSGRTIDDHGQRKPDLFQWIPIDALFNSTPGYAVERLLRNRGLQTELIPSLKSGGLQELASWFREHSR